MDSTGNLVAMLLGVASSGTLHISQALMRQGIARLRSGDRRTATRLMYTLGLLLNFTAPFWVMVANLFADTLWFTSMFATGMVALLMFSYWVMKEPVNRWQILGALCIVVGTILIATAGFSDSTRERTGFNLAILLTASVIWLVVMPAAALVTRHRALTVQEVIFGLAAGGFLALDALWKSLAQQRVDGSVGVVPQGFEAWALLGVSFLGAAGAFLMMQWSYWRHCRAAAVMVGYNLMYVTLPLALASLLALLQGRLPWNPLIVLGLVIMVVGALFSMKRFE